MQLLSMASNHHESQGSGYGQQHWIGMAGYPNTTTPQPGPGSMHDYHQQADYYAPPAMPMEPTYNMPRPPPPYTSSHALPPPPLIMPNNTLWPSMFTGQSSYQTPILPAAPIQTPVSATAHTPSDVTPTSAKSTTSRRKLTDEERRQMCVEAQQNPGIKQTQIGVKFNVERSTVSKILRQKDKYLNPAPKEDSTSPIKKSKVKFPDVERALVNWVRNEQKKGVVITDDKLTKQARFFATTSPSSESQQQITSSAWLEKFKQKNMIQVGPRKGKGSSIRPIVDDVVIVDSSTTSLSETAFNDSPTSSGLVSPPISPNEDDLSRGIKAERTDDFFNYDGKDSYDESGSLDHVLSNDLDSTGSMLSPISPELIRSSSATAEASPAYSNNFSRQRSQTFPATEIEAGSNSRPASSGHTTPGIPVRSITMNDTRPTSINPMHTVKRHKSVSDIHDTEAIHYSSMKPPPLPKSMDNSPVSPGSPTPEEAKQALHILKNFFQAQQTDVVDEDDYIMIGKLMGKLKQLKLMRRPSEADLLPGGMHPLDMFDSPRLSKKRTILGIST